MMIEDTKAVDLRVRRTRQLLQQAFMDLIAEKSFQAITVQDIAERAMVNRATFYDHFVDKYAILEHAIREGFKQTLRGKVVDECRFSAEHVQLLIQATCEYVSNIRHHCVKKDQQMMPLVQTQTTKVINEILLSWLQEMKSMESPQQTPPPLAAAITSWAIYGAALYWSQQERKEPLTAFVSQTLPAILASLGREIGAAVSSL
jgi:AcrR family transcriptional regulator